MKNIINLIVKFSGFGWVWIKVDGVKTYIAAGASILTGLGGVLGEALPILTNHDAGALWGFVKALPHDQSWLLLISGVGLLGLRHSVSKAIGAPTA